MFPFHESVSQTCPEKMAQGAKNLHLNATAPQKRYGESAENTATIRMHGAAEVYAPLYYSNTGLRLIQERLNISWTTSFDSSHAAPTTD